MLITDQYPLINARNAGYMLVKAQFGAKVFPLRIVELDGNRGNELLQSPSPGPPPTCWEIPSPTTVFKVDIAYARLLVPREHGINAFRQLCRACFVDTAGINPNPGEAIFYGLSAAELQFSPSVLLLFTFPRFNILESDLLIAPCMAQNHILGYFVAEELLELERRGIEQPHC